MAELKTEAKPKDAPKPKGPTKTPIGNIKLDEAQKKGLARSQARIDAESKRIDAMNKRKADQESARLRRAYARKVRG